MYNPPSQINTLEGCVSISDSNGVLQFYSDGGGVRGHGRARTGKIWNRNHEVMYDMQGVEGGGPSARQAAFAVPAPGERTGRYYLFTVADNEALGPEANPDQPLGRGLSYFIIDMNLNGGLGGVEVADERLYVPAFEALSGTTIADQSGYWILVSGGLREEPSIVTVPLTATGVGEPRVQQFADNFSYVQFSPDGRYVFLDTKLYHFDNSTGQVGELLLDLPTARLESTAFTADSRFAYTIEAEASFALTLQRYRLSDLRREPIELLVPPHDFTPPTFFGNLQLGPNANIYFTEYALPNNGGDQLYWGLSEITCSSSPVPVVRQSRVPFPETVHPAAYNLPNFNNAIFRELPTSDSLILPLYSQVTCGEAVVLRPRQGGDSYRWSTGAQSDTLRPSAPGTYCVTVTEACRTTIDCQEIIVVTPDRDVDLVEVPDLVQADGCDQVRGFRTDISAVEQGLRVDSVVITYGVDTRMLAMPGDTFLLELTNEPLMVTTTVFLPCGESFASTAELSLPALNPGYFITVNSDTDRLCVGREYAFLLDWFTDLEPPMAFTWYDGSDADTLFIALTDDVPVGAAVIDRCGNRFSLVYDELPVEECVCRVEFPEVISANLDGTNDVFRAFADCDMTRYSLQVFNRWGQLIFESSAWQRGWDGMTDGEPGNVGTYLYRAQYQVDGGLDLRTQEGQFVLVR